jgi:hypothetical protein
MKYDITKPSAPQMPSLGSVTKRIQILLYKAIKHPPHPSFQHISPTPALTFALPKLTINTSLVGFLWQNEYPRGRKMG